MGNLIQTWIQSGLFFQNQGTFFDFQKRTGEAFLPSPPSCTPVSISGKIPIKLFFGSELSKKKVIAFLYNKILQSSLFIYLFVCLFIYLFIYLLYLTLFYEIVENNSTNKYQQTRLKYNRNQNYNIL